MGISVLINTFNEEKNIRKCLETVKWADEIIIVDMYSDDKTVEIAKEYTDKIFYFERMG
jgi:glycosyltransferase involved in cell wall biosynthesis